MLVLGVVSSNVVRKLFGQEFSYLNFHRDVSFEVELMKVAIKANDERL